MEGVAGSAVMRLHLALKVFMDQAARHGFSTGECARRFGHIWSTIARIVQMPPSAPVGAGTAGGSAILIVLRWFWARLLTLLVAVAVTHWALGRQIPGGRGMTDQEYYIELFFWRLSSGRITRGELEAEMARRHANFSRLLAQHRNAPPPPRPPHPTQLAEGNAVQSLIVTYLNRCGRNPGVAVTPYLKLHKAMARALVSL